MKFLICTDNIFQEELEGLANALATNQQEVAGFNSNIYRAFDERKPDYMVFSPFTYNNQEIQKFLNDKQIPHFIIDAEKIVFSDGFLLNLPSFANTMKYKPELPNKELESDVVVVYDGKNQEYVHDFYDKFHKTNRIKVCGQFINCPGYVGFGSSQDIVKLAKSSRLTISTNKVIASSLIYNNILTSYNQPNPIELLNLDKLERDKLVLAEKKSIITENKLGKIILEKFSNTNR